MAGLFREMFMPVTARLSRWFYETFGDDIANELVDWFNSVDATYRTELRELNELNFARFDAKLEQRIVELRAELLQRLTESESSLRTQLLETKAELVRWMFLFWLGTALTVLGAVKL